MAKTLAPHDAEALLATESVDVVDVREPNELAGGTIAGSRNVPLAELRADPRGKLPRDRVLFVCARGVRSQTAAKLAEEIGLTDVASLDGGMQAWEAAGLPVEKPQRAAPAPAASKDDSCGLPDPGLDAVVGANLRELRKQRNISLDELARQTGLSRTVLGQIELGKTAPGVGVVWRIAQAFGVHFAALLARGKEEGTALFRAADAKRLVRPDGRYSSRPLYALAEKPDTEFYELFLAAHSREDAVPHQPGTREHLIVTTGRLELHVGEARYELARGDAIAFTADLPHAYVNPGGEDCWMYLVMTYRA